MCAVTRGRLPARPQLLQTMLYPLLISCLWALVHAAVKTVPDRDTPQNWQNDPENVPARRILCGGDVPSYLSTDDNKNDFLQCVGRGEGVLLNGEDGQAAGDLGADGEATSPAEDRALVEMLLHPHAAPGEGGIIEVAEMLMYVDVFPMCERITAPTLLDARMNTGP